MGLLLRFLSLVTLFFSLSVLAQPEPFEFELEGNYKVYEKTDPNNPILIIYTLKWNETSKDIQGQYRDNYYVNSEPATVTGEINQAGRHFNIILPVTTNGVKAISLKTSQVGATSGDVPIQISTRSDIGVELDDESTFAMMSTKTNGTPLADTNCSIGMGVLSGFCGLYRGKVTETADTNNRCNLTTFGEPVLQLGTDAELTIFLNYLNTTDNLPSHDLGTFSSAPLTSRIATGKRHCGSLAGTNFDGDNCQTLELNANFFEQGIITTVTASYVITDEVTNESCSYSLFLTREIRY